MKQKFITMENFTTGEIRQVKMGLSWDCYFSFILLYTPFFYRRLYKWVFISLFAFCLILFVITLALASLGKFTLYNSEMADQAQNYSMVVMLFLHVFFLINGNKLTAQNYYRKGFIVRDTDEAVVKTAMIRLELPEQAFINSVKNTNP